MPISYYFPEALIESLRLPKDHPAHFISEEVITVG